MFTSKAKAMYHKCKSAISGETGINFVGGWNKVFHCSTKCAGIDQLQNIGSKKKVRFISNPCVQYILT